MGNIDLRNFAPNLDDGTGTDSVMHFAGMTPGNRITDEQFEAAAQQALPQEAQALIQKEIMRQLQQVEPIYKLVHSLRVYVSKTLLKGVRGYSPVEVGFHVPVDDSININEISKKVEQTAKFLNILFEDMQGMATEITAGIRRMSLGLQTQLMNFALKFKDYSNGGEIDRSNRAEFLQDLMNLQALLGNEEINMELMRGTIR